MDELTNTNLSAAEDGQEIPKQEEVIPETAASEPEFAAAEEPVQAPVAVEEPVQAPAAAPVMATA